MTIRVNSHVNYFRPKFTSISKVVGIEYGFNDNDGKEDSALSSEESFSILDEDHDEEDFNKD